MIYCVQQNNTGATLSLHAPKILLFFPETSPGQEQGRGWGTLSQHRPSRSFSHRIFYTKTRHWTRQNPFTLNHGWRGKSIQPRLLLSSSSASRLTNTHAAVSC